MTIQQIPSLTAISMQHADAIQQNQTIDTIINGVDGHLMDTTSIVLAKRPIHLTLDRTANSQIEENIHKTCHTSAANTQALNPIPEPIKPIVFDFSSKHNIGQSPGQLELIKINATLKNGILEKDTLVRIFTNNKGYTAQLEKSINEPNLNTFIFYSKSGINRPTTLFVLYSLLLKKPQPQTIELDGVKQLFTQTLTKRGLQNRDGGYYKTSDNGRMTGLSNQKIELICNQILNAYKELKPKVEADKAQSEQEEVNALVEAVNQNDTDNAAIAGYRAGLPTRNYTTPTSNVLPLYSASLVSHHNSHDDDDDKDSTATNIDHEPPNPQH